MTIAAEFQKRVGAEVAERLGPHCTFRKSTRQIQWEAPAGRNVVIIAGFTKFSPEIELAFYFGVNYAAAHAIERKLGSVPFYCHIQQYSFSRESFNSLPFKGPATWSVDIRNPPERLAQDVVDAIHGLAEPFFSRFETMVTARDAIAADDPWCFGGPGSWRQLLLLDLALRELDHFREWMKCLGDFETGQAEEEIAAASAVLK